MEPLVESRQYQANINDPPSHSVSEGETAELSVATVPQQLDSHTPVFDETVRQGAEEAQLAVGNSKKDKPDEAERGELNVSESDILLHPFAEWNRDGIPLQYAFVTMMQLTPIVSREQAPLLLAFQERDGSQSCYPIHFEHLVTRVTGFAYLQHHKVRKNLVIPVPGLPYPEVGHALLDWFYTNKITKGDSDPLGEKLLKCITFLGGKVDGLRLLDLFRSNKDRLTSASAVSKFDSDTLSRLIQDLHQRNQAIQAFISSEETNYNVNFTFQQCAELGDQIVGYLLAEIAISRQGKTELESLFKSYKNSIQLLEETLPRVNPVVFLHTSMRILMYRN